MRIQRLLQACDQLCAKNDHRTPSSTLHYAAEQGDRDMVKLLVTEDKALVDSKDKEGWVALHHAARRGDVPTIQVLLAHHSSCLARTTYGFIPVYLALRRGHVDAVDCLLAAMPRDRRHKHVVDVYRMPSISVVAVTNPAIFKVLQKHIDKNRPEYTLWVRDVAAAGTAGTVEALVEAGLCLEAPGSFPDGWTVLHIAVHNCRDHVCNALLKQGADKDATDDKGRTPLHRAVLCTTVRGWDRTAAMVELLLNWGADVTVMDCDGLTAADLVKANTAPDRTKEKLAAMLAHARASQTSRPSLTAVRYEERLARERRNSPPKRTLLLPHIPPEAFRCMSSILVACIEKYTK